jgi:hypothetical protein
MTTCFYCRPLLLAFWFLINILVGCCGRHPKNNGLLAVRAGLHSQERT